MENGKFQKVIKDNVIRARVEEDTFRRVLAVAHRLANGSMSEVVRLCIHFGMRETENYLEKQKKFFNEKFKL